MGRIHMIAGIDKSDPIKCSVKFEPTDIDAQEAGLDIHDVHDVQNINRIRGKLKVYEYLDERAGRRKDREENINEVRMVNMVYKDKEVEEVKEPKEVTRHTDLTNKQHDNDDYIIPTNSNSNSNSNSNNIKEVYEVLQVEVDEESKVQKIKESQQNSHIHAFAKEIIEQIIESYGVQEVHEVHEVTDVNTLHTPPKYSKKITEDVTGKKQESQEVGTTTPLPLPHPHPLLKKSPLPEPPV